MSVGSNRRRRDRDAENVCGKHETRREIPNQIRHNLSLTPVFTRCLNRLHLHHRRRKVLWLLELYDTTFPSIVSDLYGRRGHTGAWRFFGQSGLKSPGLHSEHLLPSVLSGTRTDGVREMRWHYGHYML